MRAECSWPEQFRLTGFNLLLMDSSQERKRNFSPRSSRSSSLSPTRAHVLVGLRKNTGSRLPGYSRFPCELLGETCLLDGEVVAATAGRDHRRRFPRRCMTAKLPSLRGIWFTVHPDPGRCFIYRPDPGSPRPSDVKRACRIDPTDWAAGGRNTVWAKRRPNYGGPTGPSVRDQEDFTVPFCLRWWPTQL